MSHQMTKETRWFRPIEGALPWDMERYVQGSEVHDSFGFKNGLDSQDKIQ